MNSKLQAKLKRLGVVKGARDLKLPEKKPPVQPRTVEPAMPSYEPLEQHETDLTKLLPGGRIEENEAGSYFVVDQVYPFSYKHGTVEIGRILDHSPTHLIDYVNEALPDSFRDCLLIDTETTGLAGAGTIAFMIGVGFFDGEAFVVRQYFARDFSDETALLLDLAELIERFPYLISFNGKTFDIPLLKTRFMMCRLDEPFSVLPHLDLLHPARRVWRRRLQSVSLGNLEDKLLGIGRTHEDVPGWMIPGMYHQYVQTGDAREMLRVFYHNRLDIVSMVTLAHTLCHLIAAPDLAEHASDLYSLGKWQHDLGLPIAEAYLRQAASMEADIETWHATLLEIGRILKRQDRRDAAVPLWMQVAHTTDNIIDAHIELAKYFEWHDPDLSVARDWTIRAINLTTDSYFFELLDHRLKRLDRKLAKRDLQ